MRPIRLTYLPAWRAAAGNPFVRCHVFLTMGCAGRSAGRILATRGDLTIDAPASQFCRGWRRVRMNPEVRAIAERLNAEYSHLPA